MRCQLRDSGFATATATAPSGSGDPFARLWRTGPISALASPVAQPAQPATQPVTQPVTQSANPPVTQSATPSAPPPATPHAARLSLSAVGKVADDRPAIVVQIGGSLSEAHLAEVLYGIEEEGIPYRTVTGSATNAAAAAHAAALASQLGVGVGAHGDQIVVTTEKLDADQPYITQKLNARRELDRDIGSNAARLVKRSPLRDMDNS